MMWVVGKEKKKTKTLKNLRLERELKKLRIRNSCQVYEYVMAITERLAYGRNPWDK